MNIKNIHSDAMGIIALIEKYKQIQWVIVSVAFWFNVGM
jgi:hypothetical protein